MKNKKNDKYGFDSDGYDWRGYNNHDFDALDKADYNKDGYDIRGYNIKGYDKDGYNRLGFDIHGFDENGCGVDGLSKEGYNKYGYNKYGYDISGFNIKGFDKDGFDKHGFDKEGWRKNEYDINGYNKQGFNRSGFNKHGFDSGGYNRSGFNKQGFDRDGCRKDGYDLEGYDKYGLGRDGYDKDGFDIKGYKKRREVNLQTVKLIGGSMDIFNKLDLIKSKVDASKREPIFSDEIASRNNRYENTVATEQNNLLRVMATLIAFSNNAPSDTVGYMIESGVFERVFHNFDLAKVANLNSDIILANEWGNIGVIRFKKKINAIIRCANLLMKNGTEKATIESLYKNYNLPKDIKNENDIIRFWDLFDRVIAYYKKIDMPYFKNDTTLLHLLLHLGFPCIKPDLIVMKVAASLGVIKAKDNHNTYSSVEKRLVVGTIQKYCLLRNGPVNQFV